MKHLIPWGIVAVLVVFAGATCNRLTGVEREKTVAEANTKAAHDTTRITLVGFAPL